MNSREAMLQDRVKSFIEKEEHFTFPEFLRGIRKSLDIPRKIISQETGIGEMKIYYLEEGKFIRMPELAIINSLADYLNIPQDLLIRKAKAYVKSLKD